MAKLSDKMLAILRAVRDAEPESVRAWDMRGPSLAALRRRSAVEQHGEWLTLTPSGRELLEQHEAPAPVPLATGRGDNGIGVAALEPECREGNDPPHPIGAPGCVLNGWDATGPSVRLTPAPADIKREATDAEVLQLLAVLDAGGSVHRALYQQWGVLDAGPFRLNLDAVNRAARDAVRFALARQAFKSGEYTLTAEPIHLDAGNGHSACGFPLNGFTIRHRVTSDPSKVTHERCKPAQRTECDPRYNVHATPHRGGGCPLR